MARDPGLDDGVVQSDREAIARALRSQQQIGWQSSTLAWTPKPRTAAQILAGGALVYEVDQRLGNVQLERPEDTMPWVVVLKPWLRLPNLAIFDPVTPQSGAASGDFIRARVTYGGGSMGPQAVLVDWPGPGTSFGVNGVSVAVDVVGEWTSASVINPEGMVLGGSGSIITVIRSGVPLTRIVNVPAGSYTRAAFVALVNGQLTGTGLVLAIPAGPNPSSWTFDAGPFNVTFDAGAAPPGPLAILLGFTSDAPGILFGTGPSTRLSPGNVVATPITTNTGSISEAPANFGGFVSPASDFGRSHSQAPTLTEGFASAGATANSFFCPVPVKATAVELQYNTEVQTLASQPVMRIYDNRTPKKIVTPARNATPPGPFPPPAAPFRLPWWARVVEVAYNTTAQTDFFVVFYLTP